VRHHNGFGLGAERGRDGVRGDVQCDRIDFGENRDGALIEHGGESAHVGDRGGDDLIAWVGIDGADGNVDGGGAGGAGVGVLDPDLGGEGLFEAPGERALGAGERAGGDDLLEQVDFGFGLSRGRCGLDRWAEP